MHIANHPTNHCSYETKPARQRPTAQYEDVFEDKSERPFAVFDFRYRSMGEQKKCGNAIGS